MSTGPYFNRYIDDLIGLDIRWMNRRALLIAGRTHQISWKDEFQTSILLTLAASRKCIRVVHAHGAISRDKKKDGYLVRLDWTECNLGNTRPWFLCPKCDRRVAILYNHGRLTCRHCLKLTHASQNETQAERAARRADQTRKRMGWPIGILGAADQKKPKGMHWRTYHRLNDEFKKLHDIFMAGLYR